MEEQVLAKKPLTDRAIAALKPAAKGKRRLHWDALVPGFAVRVTDSGNKSFVLVTRFAGSRHPTPRAELSARSPLQMRGHKPANG